MHALETDAARSEALFLSPLQPSEHVASPAVKRAVAEVADRLGEPECAARVAQEYGDHPDVASRRMRWARRAVEEAFPDAPDRWSPAGLMVVDTARGALVHRPARWQDRSP
jgi:hypothetical protein